VWEYANTPYLKESSPRDAGLGSETPGGGVNEYDDLDAPDALDVYKRVSARYEEASRPSRRRGRKRNAGDARELRADEEYAALRSDLERKTASYARTAQVYALIEEKISAAKKGLRGRAVGLRAGEGGRELQPENRGRRARHDG
jgi:hypothetical protein